MRRAAPLPLSALAALALAGCGEAGVSGSVAPEARAALVLEPPEIGIGSVATVELVVVTPPGWAVRPYAPPEELPGVWLLSAETLPVERHATRWRHRTRVRVRARDVGLFEWPSGEVEIEGPGGAVRAVAFDAVAIEVASIRPEIPDRETPFGAVPPRPRPRVHAGALAAAAALGAALALGIAALVRLARGPRDAPARGQARSSGPGGQGSGSAESTFGAAQRRLRAAREACEGEPLRAAGAAARALRRYATDRYGEPARASTTEEIESRPPPFVATSRWPALVSILRELDELRFPAPPDSRASDETARLVRELIARAEEFVVETTPAEGVAEKTAAPR